METKGEQVTSFVLLTRCFLSRFFDGDGSHGEGEPRVTIANMLALLSLPGIIAPPVLIVKYAYLSSAPADVLMRATWIDKVFFISLFMTVMGYLTVIQWEALFPDRRDYTVLTPLPVPTATIFAAKLIALALLVGLFFLFLSNITPIMFPLLAIPSGWSLLSYARYVGSHTVATVAAGAFSFLALLSFQALLMSCLGIRLFRRVSPFVQLFLMSVLLTPLTLYSKAAAQLRHLGGGPLVDLFPPMWFLGLYETLLGTASGKLLELGRTAWIALAAATLLAALGYLLSYLRHYARILECPDTASAGPSRLHTCARRLLHRFLLPTPLQRAIFHFTWTGLLRSRRHRLYMYAYVGVGIAIVLDALLAMLSGANGGVTNRPRAELLAVQSVLAFLLLSGMRTVFTIPIDLRANWIFRLLEGREKDDYLTGVRKAMTTLGILPVLIAFLPLHTMLWGFWTAAVHLAFGCILGYLLVEILLFNFPKIPFTCSYVPGKAKLHTFWSLYWLAFSLYAYGMARVEMWMLESPVRTVAVLIGSAAVLSATVWCRARRPGRNGAFMFEEPPVRILTTLDLNA